MRVPPVPRLWGPGMEDSRFTADGFTTGVSSQCMQGQRIRYQQTGDFHFLTFSSFRRQPYLSTVAAMELFEDALERIRLRYLFVVAGYVVMPEHVHLLVNEPRRALLSKAIQALKLSVSVRGRERRVDRHVAPLARRNNASGSRKSGLADQLRKASIAAVGGLWRRLVSQ